MIRKATLADIDDIWYLRLQTSKLLKARGIDQWQSIFPTKEMFIQDINNHDFYVLVKHEKIVGMMSLIKRNEPTYEHIYEGAWHSDLPYMTIHRFAILKSYHGQGLSDEMLNYAKNIALIHHIYYLRIDTHEDNIFAIKRFKTNGFQYCGYILLSEKHPTTRKRLAFDLLMEDEYARFNQSKLF